MNKKMFAYINWCRHNFYKAKIIVAFAQGVKNSAFYGNFFVIFCCNACFLLLIISKCVHTRIDTIVKSTKENSYFI